MAQNPLLGELLLVRLCEIKGQKWFESRGMLFLQWLSFKPLR